MTGRDDSTKNTKRKKSLRSETKFPGLDKKFSLKLRQDYHEADYVDGVRNEHGEMVMRPLKQEEKDFLNKFNEEVVNTNFLHDKELRDIHNKIKSLEFLENPTDEQLQEYMYLKMLYLDRADESLLYSNEKQQKKIWGENNARNRCVYNRAKASGTLKELNPETYDEEENND